MSTDPRLQWLLDRSPPKIQGLSSGGNPSFPAGKYYFEVTFVAGDGVKGIMFGIAMRIAQLWDIVNITTNVAQVSSQHSLFWTVVAGSVNGWGYPVKPGAVVGATVGDVFAVAVDSGVHGAWIRNVTQNTSWGGDNTGHTGDPTLGLAGFPATFTPTGMSPMTGALNIIVGCNGPLPFSSSNYGKGTINAGATSFAGTMPTGYSAWGSGTVINASDNSFLNITNGGLSFDSNGLSFPGSNQPVNAARSQSTIGS